MMADPRDEIQRPALANVEAEQALLGALLFQNQVLEAACGDLLPEHFAEPIHGRIFEAAASMIRDGKVASPITVKTYFERDATLAEIGGTTYLARLAGAASPPVAAPSYADEVRRLALRRLARTTAEQAIYDIENLAVDQKPEEFVADLAQTFATLGGTGSARQSRLSGAGLAALAVDSAAAAYQNKGDPDAIPSGLVALDEKIGGLHRGDLVIIGARPSMGKTALGLSLAVSAAKRGLPAAFLSLEMRNKQLGHRALSMAAYDLGFQIPYQRIQSGRFSPAEFSTLTDAGEAMKLWKFHSDERDSMSLGQIRSAAVQIKTRQPDLALLVVDYLGLVQVTDRYRGMKVYELAEVSAGLKGLAKRLDLTVVALHQLSRGTESRENKRPTLADLRESGAIEQDADVVILPYRDEYYAARELESAVEGSSQQRDLVDRLRKAAGVMELIVAKNRMGPIGTGRVRANMACNVIEDFSETANPQEEMTL